MKSNKIVLSLIGGIAIGALLGVLFAPEKGIVTRKKIMCNDDNYSETLLAEFESLVNSILDEYNCTRKQAEDLVSKGYTTFDV